MGRLIVGTAIAGWVVGVALLLVEVAGGLPSIGESATAAGSEQRFTEDEALTRAKAWAAESVESTIGSEHNNKDGSVSEAVRAGGEPLQLEDMELVDLRLLERTSQAVVAIYVGVSFEEQKDFWVGSWEREGVANGRQAGMTGPPT